MCYNIVRQYDEHAEVFASFSHSWTDISNVGWYTSKEIVDLLNTYALMPSSSFVKNSLSFPYIKTSFFISI